MIRPIDGTEVTDRAAAAAKPLGVNYRTVVWCQQSRRVSQRMRQVLQEFRDAQDVGDHGSRIVAGDSPREDAEETQQDRAVTL